MATKPSTNDRFDVHKWSVNYKELRLRDNDDTVDVTILPDGLWKFDLPTWAASKQLTLPNNEVVVFTLSARNVGLLARFLKECEKRGELQVPLMPE